YPGAHVDRTYVQPRDWVGVGSQGGVGWRTRQQHIVEDLGNEISRYRRIPRIPGETRGWNARWIYRRVGQRRSGDGCGIAHARVGVDERLEDFRIPYGVDVDLSGYAAKSIDTEGAIAAFEELEQAIDP